MCATSWQLLGNVRSTGDWLTFRTTIPKLLVSLPLGATSGSMPTVTGAGAGGGVDGEGVEPEQAEMSAASSTKPGSRVIEFPPTLDSSPPGETFRLLPGLVLQ